ncbi:MAG: GNAT family N-acetyltransferase [Candidatus Electrothrix sp. AR4]|nr:GNAT family N-acetyltransferase [Candidatus Electrothrix sp. AR4]
MRYSTATQKEGNFKLMLDEKKLCCTVERVVTKELFNEWHALWTKQKGHYFNSPYWYKASIDAFAIKERDMYLFICREKGELVGVLPLIRGKKYGLDCLQFPGEQYLDQACILIFDQRVDVTKSLVETAKSTRMLIYLSEVREVHLFDQCKFFEKSSSECPYLNMRTGPFQEMKPKKYRRRKNKIKKNSEQLEFKVFEGEDVAEHIDVMFEVEKNSPKAKRNEDIFSDKYARKLYENIIDQGDGAVLAVLYYNSKAVAHLFALRGGDSITDIHTAYVEGYKTLSPGTLLLLQFIEHVSNDKGVRTYDLSRGMTVQKKEYTSKVNKQYDVYIAHSVVMSTLVRSIFNCREILKRIKWKSC